MENPLETKKEKLEPEFVKLFAVEELEERMEFAKWSAFIEGDSKGTIKGGVKAEF